MHRSLIPPPGSVNKYPPHPPDPPKHDFGFLILISEQGFQYVLDTYFKRRKLPQVHNHVIYCFEYTMLAAWPKNNS